MPISFRPCAMALIALCLCALGASAAAAAARETQGYHANQGRIYAPDGQEIQLRGVNLYGFNAPILIPTHLWNMGWKAQIQQIKDLGFNAIRLPYVPETLYSKARVNDGLDTYVEPTLNPELQGKTPLEVMDLWMAEARRQQLYVLLDFHSVSKKAQYKTWYNDDPKAYGEGGWAQTYNAQAYSTDDWIRDLKFVAERYADNPWLIGIDLFNEPYGVVRWGPGDQQTYRPENDWKIATEKAAAAVLKANPRLLIFVQGIEANWDGIEKPGMSINYGENLQPQAYRPLDIAQDKLVLSPHTYGPDALAEYPKKSFGAPDYPANLAADWETLFGQFQPRHPVIIGEFGGFYGTGPSGGRDRQWQDALVDYLVSKGMRSSFYWTYTPNSYNTGGILDEQLQVREDKMALLRRLWGVPAAGAAAKPAVSP